MKKNIAIMLAAILLLAAIGCHSPNTGSGTDPTDEPAFTEQVTPEPTEEPVVPTEAPTPEPTVEPDPLDAYDKNDYGVLCAFFELKDEDGITNGSKLFPNYDPAAPSTWIDEDPYRYNSVTWDDRGRVSGLGFRGTDDAPIELVGKLDLDLFDALNEVNSWNVIFEEIAADGLPVTAKQNNACFQFLMVNGEARFTGGYVERLYLLSATHVFCDITGEAESHLSMLPSYKINLTVEGNGFAGVSSYGDENYYEVHLIASPADGEEFLGWFDAAGKLISTDEDYTLFGEDSGANAEGAHAEFVYTARFE